MPLPGSRTYLGLNLAHGTFDCAGTALVCEKRPATLYAGTMLGKYWGAEVGYVDAGRQWRNGIESRASGVNLSFVGRAQVASSFGVFGKVGATYGRSDTSVLGNNAAFSGDPGFGLSFGGGVSYNITPQLSATFEWDSHDMRLSSGPLRSTSLGLQLRY